MNKKLLVVVGSVLFGLCLSVNLFAAGVGDNFGITHRISSYNISRVLPGNVVTANYSSMVVLSNASNTYTGTWSGNVIDTMRGGTGTAMLSGIIKGNGLSPFSAITDNSANWDTAYADRLKWDGGSTGLVAATGRTSLGLGSMAEQSTTNYYTTSNINASFQPVSDVLSNFAAYEFTSGTPGVDYPEADTLYYATGLTSLGLTRLYENGRSLIAQTSSANMRSVLVLGNVENTALSTWAGSTNLTTLGQVATISGITPTLNVTNGLVVDTDTLYVNSGLSRVGVGTILPKYLFSVVGNMGVTGNAHLVGIREFSGGNTNIEAQYGTAYLNIKSSISDSNGMKISYHGGTTTGRIINHFNGPVIIGTNDTDRITVSGSGNLYGSSLHDNATLPTGVVNQAVGSGTYTPTITSVANVSANATLAQWIRVGNVVTVSGALNVDPTVITTTTTIGISFPLSSNITAVEGVGGTAYSINFIEGGAIYGDGTNDRAELKFTSVDVTEHQMSYSFTYLMK